MLRLPQRCFCCSSVSLSFPSAVGRILFTIYVVLQFCLSTTCTHCPGEPRHLLFFNLYFIFYRFVCLFVSFVLLSAINVALSTLLTALQGINSISVSWFSDHRACISLWGIGADTGYAGCRRVERTVSCYTFLIQSSQVCAWVLFKPLFLPIGIQHTQCPCSFIQYKLCGHKTTTQCTTSSLQQYHHVYYNYIYSRLLSWPFFSLSLLVVTQIRCHIAHSRLFPPLPTRVGALHFYRQKISALPSSTRAQGALSSWSFSIFANKFKISPRRDSNSRTNTSSIRGLSPLSLLIIDHKGDRL